MKENIHLHHLRIRQLWLLVWISEGHTLVQIAQRLHVSAAAVSVMLQELEATLGLVVCERDRRGARPTPVGIRLAQRAQVMLAEFTHFEAELQAPAAHEQILRIGLIPQATIQWLPRLLRAYRDLQADGNAQVSVIASEGTSGALLARADAGELSGVLVRMGPSLDDEAKKLAAQLELDVLGSERVGIMLSASHPLHKRARITAQDLAALEWVLPEPGSYIRRMLELHFQKHGLPMPRTVLQVDTTAQALWCATQLGCAAAGPLSLLDGFGLGWKLKALPVKLGEPVKLGFFYRASQRQMPAFEQLRRAVRHCASNR
jgi:DNA-binding transcriptional LysR family regulator